MLLQSMVKRCEGPKVRLDLLDGGGVAAHGLRSGSGDAADERQKAGQRIFDVDDMPVAVIPSGEVGGRLGVFAWPLRTASVKSAFQSL